MYEVSRRRNVFYHQTQLVFMKILRQNVGIEVDAKKLKLSFQQLEEGFIIKIVGSRTFDNSVISFPEIKQWIDKKKAADVAVNITMEATGVYYENVAYFFTENSDYEVHVVLGNISKAYLKSLNMRSKTDEIDAKGLGQMGVERVLDIWNPASSQMRTIKKMCRERNRMIKQKTMTSNQLHSELASYEPSQSVVERSVDRIEFLEKQIKAVVKEIKLLVEKDEVLTERIDNVCTIRGVAFITAISVVSEANGFILIKNRSQLVSYCGYDIKKKESGTSIKGVETISKQGNSHIRGALYMAAMSAVQHDEHHKNYYTRIVEKTSLKMKGNVAIQRKLLLLIYALFTKNEAYNPMYHIEMAERLKQNYKVKLKVKGEQIAELV